METDQTILRVRVHVSLTLIVVFLAVMMTIYVLSSTDLRKKFAGLMKEHAADRPFYCHFTSVTVRRCMYALRKVLDLIRSFSGYTINLVDITEW